MAYWLHFTMGTHARSSGSCRTACHLLRRSTVNPTLGLRLRPGHHVDMLRYTRGGFIHRHVDMVAGGTLAHATHMSVLVGLQTLPEGAGGHTLVWANDDDRDASPTRYAEAGRAGGVLAFDSRMPHAGEVLRCGEKEVLVLSAWCDDKDWSPPSPRLRGDDLLDVRCRGQ